MGGENGCPGAEYARLSNDPLRTSTPVQCSPHFALLREYVAVGPPLFDEERFAKTSYGLNALRCIELQGHYFGATSIGDVLDRARRVCAAAGGGRWEPLAEAETAAGEPVMVRRIAYSDCYEVLDGHHRLALAALRGATRYPCAIVPVERSLTEMQRMVMHSSGMPGKSILYQPISCPEFRHWIVMRECADRLQMMAAYLTSKRVLAGSYLDICCSYGWFVDEMRKRGYEAFGVNENGAAVAVGRIAYGLPPSAIEVAGAVDFLSTPRQYDVVSCFGVLHRFLRGQGSISAVDLIKLVDRSTGSILFIDAGEDHERRFKRSMASWDRSRIAAWLREHTSFNLIESLGTDRASEGKYRDQFGRYLFACTRSEAKVA